MNDESNVCMTCNIVWVPKEAHSAAIAQIESLTRDVEKYQKRAFVTTGIIDTLRAELGAAKKPLGEPAGHLFVGRGGVTARAVRGVETRIKDGEYWLYIDPRIDTARSRGETGEKIG